MQLLSTPSIYLEEFEMATATELRIIVAKLEERIDNHIKFFWMAVAGGFGWLAVLSLLLYNINYAAKKVLAEQTEIKNGLIDESLAIYAALPPDRFKATLPDVASTVAKAQKQNIKVPERVVSELQSKLMGTDTTAPNYWPTAAALISYHSSLVAGTLQNASKHFPPCPEPISDPTIQLVGPDGKPQEPKYPISRMGTQDCFIDLDGREITRWDCTRCLVKYSGGPLSIKDANFVDCLFVFDFPSQQPPPRGGQLLSQAILKSELKYVTIPA